MDELLYRSIIDSLDMPIIAAKPIQVGESVVDYKVIYVNFSFKNKLFDLQEGSRLFSFTHKIAPDVDWQETVLTAKETAHAVEKQFFIEEKNTWYNIELKFLDNGTLLACLYDITAKNFYNEKFRQAVLTDTLTALPNRIQFNKVFSETVHIAEQENKRFTLMFFDVDNIKAINDSKGQPEGDRILIRTAKILLGFERENIQVFRTGGDEFAVLVTNLDSKETASAIGKDILGMLQENDINISAGLANFPDDSDSGHDLLKFADLAIHAAKEDGKNRIECFTPQMHKVFLRKTLLKSKTPQAFENHEFQLYFQPQFDIAKNTLRGFEALLRWDCPTIGRISPDEFIPIAEETGFIVKLGEWVLDTAFTFQKKWETKFDYNGIMSINVSPVQLKEKNFISMLRETAEKNEINPHHVEIEITEGVMIQDAENVIEILDEIKEMGFGLSLDDFGTGYSSLRYLQILPLTTLKIDKSFVQSITENNSISADITNAIISMVTKMGLDTIAEGVEKDDQLLLLKNLHCKNVQGFLRGKPMPSARVESYLSGNNAALDKLENDAEAQETIA